MSINILMKILVSGCSFTQWPDGPGGPNTCWPRYLGEINPALNITSVAEAAAGNQYICESVIRMILENPDAYDHVIVMWSGVSRLDFLTSLEDKGWRGLFDSYGFYRKLTNDKLGWIFSGGQIGTWFRNAVAHKIFNEQYKVSSPLSLASINLTEMVKLQNFLENKNITFTFMSYVNYWGCGDYVSPNGDFGVADIPEIQYLVRELDFDKWFFTNDAKDGLYELAKELNDFMEDGFHPGAATHQAWAELVNRRINN
jgi:hypothetical protein